MEKVVTLPVVCGGRGGHPDAMEPQQTLHQSGLNDEASLNATSASGLKRGEGKTRRHFLNKVPSGHDRGEGKVLRAAVL